MVGTAPQDHAGPLSGKRVGFLGRLGGLSRRDARQLVRRHGGVPVEQAREAELIVIGADELPLADEQLLDADMRLAADEGRAEIITETELWERIGLLGAEIQERKLYTPAMLAGLLQVPVTTVRRWHRRGLIVPLREVHHLPYFDFQEVTTARRLANMLAAGIPPTVLEKKLAALSRYVRGVDRPLAQLSIIVEGRQILLRQQEGLVEPSGQLRFDFDSLEWNAEPAGEAAETCGNLTFPAAELRSRAGRDCAASFDELIADAEHHEALGDLESAIEFYRSALALAGPKADVCFQLAELLYRCGELAAARERYYMAIELDESFVEARANLGCVLAESGQLELAVAAFQGALALHPAYADAHYHLARSFGELGRIDESLAHWHQFLDLAPDSPWADEARRWLAAGRLAQELVDARANDEDGLRIED